MDSRRLLIALALVAGAGFRLAAIPRPGATDLPVFELWADTAASEGVGGVYGTGGVFPERRLLERDGVRTKVNYPPLLLYEFVLARAARLPLKALTAASDALLTWLLWAAIRRRAPDRGRAATAALAYWLNPAALLTGSLLGYAEPLMALPATAAILLASSRRSFAAGGVVAAAVLTKQLAVLSIPASLIPLLAPRDGRRGPRAALFAAGAIVVALAATGQVLMAGGILNMSWSLAAALRDPFLSGAAANSWWLIGLTGVNLPLDACRAAGAAMTIAAIAWATARAARQPDVWMCAAAGGLSIHAYHVLAVSVHEAHLFAAVPLLTLAAAGRPRLWLPCAAVSAIAALNVYLYYANLPGLALLAVCNCAAFVWHARRFARECSLLTDRCPSTTG